MTRVATAANEAVLVCIARHATASHVEKFVRKYRWTQRRDAEKTAQSQHLNRSVNWYFDENETLALNARLPPEIGALVAQALLAARKTARFRRLTGFRTRPSPDDSAESSAPITTVSSRRLSATACSQRSMRRSATTAND